MNINKYLAEAEEKFSGFGGDDYDEFVADDLDFDGGADYFEVEGGGTATSPTPYQVSITNTNASMQNAILFGRNKFLLTPNFGSAVGVTCTPSQTNVTYLELLNQSADQPFETSLIRIQSSNGSQITQVLTVTSKDSNGQEATIPIITQSYFSANQFQSTILDVPFKLKVDANVYITIPVLANTTVVFTFFPSEKLNASRVLGGKSGRKIYAAPAVSIGIPTMPVRSARPVFGRPRVSGNPSQNRAALYE